jgi:multiple sugar transport system substrate-binding protein
VDDFFDYMWEGLVHPDLGIRMGLPTYPGFYQYYYNKEAFDEAGIDYPGGDWTVDDYSAILEGMTQRDADGNVTRWGALEISYSAAKIQMWLRMFGGEMVDPADRTLCVLSSEESQAALEWHRERLWDTNTLGPFMQVGVNDGTGFGAMAAGRIAMIGQGSPDIAALFQNPPGFEWGVAIPPIGPTGEREGSGGASSWGLWSGTAYPEMAWEFLKLLAVEDDFQIGQAAVWGGPPNRKSLLDGFIELTLNQYPETALREHLEPQVDQLTGDYVQVPSYFKRSKESDELIQPVLQQILVVGDTPVSAVEEVCEEVTALNRA